MEQGVDLDEPRVGKQTTLDRLGLLALVVFNLAALAGVGWIVLRAVGSLL
jgi:hypothetical protein